MKLFSRYKSVCIPGDEFSEPIGTIRTETRNGQLNPELILLGVPVDLISDTVRRLQINTETGNMRLVVTNTRDSRLVKPLGTVVHWVDFKRLDFYLENLS